MIQVTRLIDLSLEPGEEDMASAAKLLPAGEESGGGGGWECRVGLLLPEGLAQCSSEWEAGYGC